MTAPPAAAARTTSTSPRSARPNLTSAPHPHTLNATAGNDSLVGGSGNDTINGLGGNDTLAGQGGNDLLNGGTGNDSLTGGTGADTFAFDAAPGTANADTIADFV